MADIPTAMMGEQDGSVLGYMCLTDFECELGGASGGNEVYPSVVDLKLHRKCAESCGIVQVRVTAVAVVQPAREPENDN